jgi:Regulator of chromosome condensation (RCC1) repeat
MRRQHRSGSFPACGDPRVSRLLRSHFVRPDLHSSYRRRNCGTKNDRSFFSTKIYAIGEGWTGSFGSGRLDQRIAGHHDDEIEEADPPLLVYETDKPVTSCAVGWGHSAFIHDQHKLLMTGRPHEFSSLLRLARLPNLIRQYAIQQTHRAVHPDDETSRGFQLTDILGRPIAFLSGIFLQDTDWDAARMQSEMVDWTPYDTLMPPDSSPAVHVSCSAGFTAVTTQSGQLYTFGLNSIGQCGTGETSNNVWVPQPVTGLTRASDDPDAKVRMILEQSHPIVSSALGLQRT